MAAYGIRLMSLITSQYFLVSFDLLAEITIIMEIY